MCTTHQHCDALCQSATDIEPPKRELSFKSRCSAFRTSATYAYACDALDIQCVQFACQTVPNVVLKIRFPAAGSGGGLCPLPFAIGVRGQEVPGDPPSWLADVILFQQCFLHFVMS